MTKSRQAKLAECVELLSGFAFKSQQFTGDPDEVARVKGENVSQGRVLWDISKRWPLVDWEKFEKFQLAVGDVVVAMDRPWVPAGLKWCSIRDHDPKALLVQRCCRLKLAILLKRHSIFTDSEGSRMRERGDFVKIRPPSACAFPQFRVAGLLVRHLRWSSNRLILSEISEMFGMTFAENAGES